MKKSALKILPPALSLVSILAVGCGSDDLFAAGEGHTEDRGGVGHRPGGDDPLENCVRCHGKDLDGGDGPSCYDCHDDGDHARSRGGVMHRSGGDCAACHGPNKTGGLGPACSDCHG